MNLASARDCHPRRRWLVFSLLPLLCPLAACQLVFPFYEAGAGRGVDAGLDAHVYQDDAGEDSAACNADGRPPSSSLTFDFSGNSFGFNWSPDHGGTCEAASDGGLVAGPATDADIFCILYDNVHTHLTCSSLTVKVPVVGVQAPGVQTDLYVVSVPPAPDGGNNRIDLILEDRACSLTMTGTAEGGGIRNVPYDPSADVWWRLRESAGQLYFDTSADGTTWAPRAQEPDPIPLEDIIIGLGVGEDPTVGNNVNSGLASFRCLNAGSGCR